MERVKNRASPREVIFIVPPPRVRDSSSTGFAPTDFPIVLAEAGIAFAEQWFDLPPALLPAEPAGGSVWVTARQNLCGQISPSLSPNPVVTKTDLLEAAAVIAEPVYDCATQALVSVTSTLTTYQAFLDNGSPLSDPVSCLDAASTTPRLIINLYRPLHTGEVFHVAQSGCIIANQSASVKVQALPKLLPAPVFTQPIRPGATLLNASEIVPGARVSLYVNGQWRTTVKTLETTVIFGVSPLAENDRVTGTQALCDQYSTNEPKAAVVTRGQMLVTVTPTSVVRSSHTAVTVTAVDADTKAAVDGAVVLINSAMVGVTGTAFVFSPAKGLASAAGVVQSPLAYVDAPFTIALTDPAPPLQRTTDVYLNLGGYPTLNGAVTVKDVKWTVVPQWGAKAPVTGADTHATVTIPALPAGPALVNVSLDFTVVLDTYVNGVPVHDSAPSRGLDAATMGKTPTVVDLSLAPNHTIGFYEAMNTDQYGTPYFYAVYNGAQ